VSVTACPTALGSNFGSNVHDPFWSSRKGVGTRPNESRGDLMLAPAPKILIWAGFKKSRNWRAIKVRLCLLGRTANETQENTDISNVALAQGKTLARNGCDFNDSTTLSS